MAESSLRLTPQEVAACADALKWHIPRVQRLKDTTTERLAALWSALNKMEKRLAEFQTNAQ